jgi:hypothetical protein
LEQIKVIALVHLAIISTSVIEQSFFIEKREEGLTSLPFTFALLSETMEV